MKAVAGRVSGTVEGRAGRIRLSEETPRRGGQAEVYRGVTAQGVVVAVKIALDGQDERRGLIAEREALTAIHRRQPGSERWLVPILDEGELHDGRPFLVLPWVEHSMQSWVRVRQPDLRKRLRALALTAEAVVQLHRSAASLAGVVLHRDLKPGNLLVEEDGDDLRVMLADLGGAKERAFHGATRNTGIHTPWFAPLEQALPLERPPDPSVDVHALAVVIYTVLVGRAPQAVMSRTGLLTHAAEELIQLHQAGGGRTAADKARYVELRRAPLELLIELDHAIALADDDVARLRQALTQQFGEPSEHAEALAAELTGILAPPIRHALEPNPRLRLSRPETLLGTVTAALERLPVTTPVVEVNDRPDRRPAVAMVEEGDTEASVPAEAPPRVTPPIRLEAHSRSPSSLLLLAALSAVLLLICAGLTSLASLAPWWAEDGAVAAKAEPAPGAVNPAVLAESEVSSPASSVAEDGARSHATSARGIGGARTTTESDRAAEPAQVAGGAGSRSTSPSPSPIIEPAPPPAPNPDPLVIVFVVEGDGGATGTVNGRSLGPVLKRDDLGSGTYAIVLAANIAGEPRTFDLVLTPKDDDTWQVALRDAKRKADSPVTRKEGQKVIVRWGKDGRLRFETTRSSDP